MTNFEYMAIIMALIFILVLASSIYVEKWRDKHKDDF